MNRKSRIIAGLAATLILIIVMAWCGVLPRTTLVQANGPADVQVSLNAPDEVSSDSDFTVTVDVSQVDNFDAADYCVSINPTVLRLDDVVAGDIAGTAISVDRWGIWQNPPGNPIPGTYKIINNVPGFPGVTGAGTLAKLHFHVIGSSGASSNIGLTNGILGNNSAQAIPATWTGDSLNVLGAESTEGESPPPTPPSSTSPELPTTDLPSVIDTSGVFTQNVITESADRKAKLTISQGTVGLTKEKEPISEIIIAEVIEVTQFPDPPSGYNTVGSVYDLGLDGATFDPPITLTLTYVPGEIPEGTSEESLVIAYWEADTDECVIVENCVVDSENNTITASISHFTTFAILAYIPPVPSAVPASPVFSITDPVISPSEIGIGESVTISAVVSNSGSVGGNYGVNLNINGKVEESRTIDLAAGENKLVSFMATRNVAGSYTVSINGRTGVFTIKALPPLPPSPRPSPAPIPAEPAPVAQPGGVNWPALWGIIGGVVILIALFVFFRYGIRRS